MYTPSKYLCARNLSLSALLLTGLIILSSCSTIRLVGFQSIVEKKVGNKVFLKKGSFVINEPIVLSSGAELIGNNTTLIPSDEHPYPIIKIVGQNHIKIKGISIVSKELKNSNDKNFLQKCTYQYYIEVKNSNNIKIIESHFKNALGTVIKVLDSQKIRIKNCSFENIGVSTYKGVSYSYDAIYLGGYEFVKDVDISLCTFSNIGKTFPPGNNPWPNDGDGVHILTEGLAYNIKITNCIFENCSARGVKIQSGHNILVNNNIFRNGWSAVLMPMLKEISDITISNNKVFNNKITFGTDKAGDYVDAVNLSIINNEVDSCIHFFRTNGYSNVKNCIIKNNRIENVGQFVISGRFRDSEISNNKISAFATQNHKSWNMAILLSPESENVHIENNVFGILRAGTKIIDNRSSNEIFLKNNVLNDIN